VVLGIYGLFYTVRDRFTFISIQFDKCVVDEEKPKVDTRDEGKYTVRNPLLFIERMMWMDERV